MKNSIVLFFISPFIGIVQGFKHFREDWAKNSILFFIIFYGFTMITSDGMDSSRYIANLQVLNNSEFTWNSFFQTFYTVDEDGSGSVDIYQPLFTYLISIFTSNGHILFAFFGAVFGYFYSRNIWLLLDLTKKVKMNKTLWLLIFSFIFVIGFWNLGGVRMWTAAHVFFYGTFIFLIQNKKKGILIAFSSILIHFSFILPVGILLIYYFSRMPIKILYYIFIFSFFVSALDVGFIRTALENYAPGFLIPRVKGYVDEDYVEVVSNIDEAGVWYITNFSKIQNWYIIIMFSIAYFHNIYKDQRFKPYYKLFGFTLLFLTIGNILAVMPSGGRYLMIAQLFAMGIVFIFAILYIKQVYNRWLHLLVPFLIFFVVISVRISLETVTFVTVLANPIVAPFIDIPIPLINLIK